jgi:hypothetical protein
MSEVKSIYSLKWCVQSVNVVGYSPEYVVLCCVAGAMRRIQSNLLQYMVLCCVAGALRRIQSNLWQYVVLCCMAGALRTIQSNLWQYLISVLLILLKAVEVLEIQKSNCCVTPLDLSELSVKIQVSQDVMLCC